MIEKNRIQHFPSRIGQPKRNVADPENSFDVRYFLLNQPHAFNRFHRAAYVVLVAGRAGKHKRIDDDVLGTNSVVVIEKLD